jgi:hypothetical protein
VTKTTTTILDQPGKFGTLLDQKATSRTYTACSDLAGFPMYEYRGIVLIGMESYVLPCSLGLDPYHDHV